MDTPEHEYSTFADADKAFSETLWLSAIIDAQHDVIMQLRARVEQLEAGR